MIDARTSQVITTTGNSIEDVIKIVRCELDKIKPQSETISVDFFVHILAVTPD